MADVADLLATYQARIDAEAPGLLQGLYLVGSLALDDYRPGVSDVDFVAVTESPVNPDVPAERHPVTWHTLASHGVPVRGPAWQCSHTESTPDAKTPWPS